MKTLMAVTAVVVGLTFAAGTATANMCPTLIKQGRDAWARRNHYGSTEARARLTLYGLEVFPCPSGRIAMGQVATAVMVALLADLKAMPASTVPNPRAWAASGLPAENAAIEHGVHPAI